MGDPLTDKRPDGSYAVDEASIAARKAKADAPVQKWQIVLAAVGISLILLGIGLDRCSSAIDTATPPKYTYAQYEQVANGMYLPDVRAVFGSLGTNSSETPGLSYWQWTNADGTNATIAFDGNQQVIGKSQLGLE